MDASSNSKSAVESAHAESAHGSRSDNDTQQLESTAYVNCCGRFMKVDYVTNTGRWLTFYKLMAMMVLPVVGAWTFSLYSVIDNIAVRDDTRIAQTTMQQSIYIGRLIYRIQKERDMTLLYISRIGPGTKSFLIRDYDGTDDTFASLWAWPDEFAAHPQKEFRSKRKLISYINAFRTQMDPSITTPKEALDFYSSIVDFFIDWMVDNIKEAGFGDIWKSLVVFHKITRCMLDTGAERAYGTIFFAQGNFPVDTFYGLYFRRIHRFNYSYRSATYYSDLVDPLRDERTDQRNITTAIQRFRSIIKYSNMSGSYQSAANAQAYFDYVSIRVEYLFSLQEQVADRVVVLINGSFDSIVIEIASYSIVIVVVVIMCPFTIFFSHQLTSFIQLYTRALIKSSQQLTDEQEKTDTLLHQMLPKSVVQELKNGHKVESKFFKSVTILFSGIVNFTQMSIELTPMELVGMLNLLYTSIDERIDSDDLYKVETINDTYMVVSGVPNENGVRHATAIANFALDIKNLIRNFAYTSELDIPGQLQLGACSGSVSAGIIGTATLRYCLFGDTVNIASRMKSYSKPNRIHISESLFTLLDKTQAFKLQPRGLLEVKGKGKMNTYWLVDHAHGPTVQQSPVSSFR